MQESSLTSKKARILVVDDEPVNVKLLEVHLMTDGYEVITASGGKEALEKIASDTVDLILLDVMMPELDGYEVTRRLKSDEKTRLIPIVLLTSLRETEVVTILVQNPSIRMRF
jgi:CheY-like chemotaxis protein